VCVCVCVCVSVGGWAELVLFEAVVLATGAVTVV
jgi:hypothetical protein